MSRTPRFLARTLAATACSLGLLGSAFVASAQTATGSGTTTGTPAGSTGTAPARATTAPATGTGAATTAAASLDRSDRAFLEKAAMAGMAEVAMGRMAQQKATMQPVKDYAARMVEDHTKANSELMQLASTKGLNIPAEMDRSHRKDGEKMGEHSGAKFDREYMEHMVKDHKKTVSDFEKASKSAKDPEVKAFAAKQLPILQEHLRMAQSIHDAAKNAK